MERMVLTFDSGMLDHRSCICLEPGHCAADVLVYLDDLFDAGGFEEGGGHALFDTKEDAIACCYL